MCAKLPYAPNNNLICGSDHAKYTKSRFTEDKSKHHKNKKGSCGWK